MYLYAIRDKKAQSFDTPFPAANDGVAARMFSDLVNRSDNLVGQHPEDFELARVAFFDPATGYFVAEPDQAADYCAAYDSLPPLQPVFVCSAVSLVKAPES